MTAAALTATLLVSAPVDGRVLYAGSLADGAVLATYSFPGTNRFLNDLVVTRSAVYVTDSTTRSWPWSR